MAAKGNRVRTPVVDETEEVIEKQPVKEKVKDKPKRKQNPTPSPRFEKIREFFSNEKGHKVTGLFLILMSVFMLIAFTSFFFTWTNDHDKVSGSWFDLFTRPDVKVDNWLGKFGAILSHQLIEKWFGISAFVFVLVSFVTGFKILFKIELMPIIRTLKFSFFTFFFVAASLGYIIGSNGKYLFLAGAFGFEMNKWMQSIVGNAGTGLILGFIALSFVVVVFNIGFRLPAFLNPATKAKKEVENALQAVAENAAGNRVKNEFADEVIDHIENEVDLELEIAETDLEEPVAADESITFDLEEESVPVPISSTEMEIEMPPITNEEIILEGAPGAVPLSIEVVPSDSQVLNEAEVNPMEVLG
ncbi:MAG TPA: DNA translocase FtsK 4TM domain-containing protein, partial [Bacteroidia bacterium]|nr:DNA translocase FtsK 4TM domain-containing protein [Bacteroidia bacterium]